MLQDPSLPDVSPECGNFEIFELMSRSRSFSRIMLNAEMAAKLNGQGSAIRYPQVADLSVVTATKDGSAIEYLMSG